MWGENISHFSHARTRQRKKKKRRRRRRRASFGIPGRPRTINKKARKTTTVSACGRGIFACWKYRKTEIPSKQICSKNVFFVGASVYVSESAGIGAQKASPPVFNSPYPSVEDSPPLLLPSCSSARPRRQKPPRGWMCKQNSPSSIHTPT